MKVIVTGATGFVGSEVVRKCIDRAEITSVIALGRRAIDQELSKNEKVQVVINENMETYPQEVLDQLKGAEACISALGGKAGDFPDIATAKKVHSYNLAAAQAFQTKNISNGKKFRFVFCSGMGAEEDASKSLWLMADTRLIKGATEEELFEFAESHSDDFEVTVFRPGGILSEGSIVPKMLPSMMVDVSVLASAFVEAVINRQIDKIIENDGIAAIASKAARS